MASRYRHLFKKYMSNEYIKIKNLNTNNKIKNPCSAYNPLAKKYIYVEKYLIITKYYNTICHNDT